MAKRRKASGKGRTAKVAAKPRAQRKASPVQIEMFAAPVASDAVAGRVVKAAKSGKVGKRGKVGKAKRAVETEAQAQARLVALLGKAAAPGMYWHSIVNEGPRSARMAARLKATGLKAGVPDMLFIVGGVPRYLELKREKGGRVSEDQHRAHAAIERAGAVVKVAFGFNAAVDVLRGWGALTV